MQNYSIVIVVHASDLGLMKQHLPIIYHFLKVKQVVIISSQDVESEIINLNLKYIKFLNEDQLIPHLKLDEVKKIIKKRCHSTERAGWYFQQFLKMAYAYICEDDWYLLWDIDTIPLKRINFFNKNGKVIFDMKSEFHKPYFYTIKKLIGIDKTINKSFIAEHMLINKKIMIDLFEKIEANKKITGDVFFEKILFAIPINDLAKSGFSEYETYGNFFAKNYPDFCVYRELRTLREAKKLLGNTKNKKLLKWASKSYDILSFEKYHKTNFLFYIGVNSFLHYFISMKDMWNIYKKLYVGKYYE